MKLEHTQVCDRALELPFLTFYITYTCDQSCYWLRRPQNSEEHVKRIFLRTENEFLHIIHSEYNSCHTFYRPQGEGNVFTGVCLCTIGLMATGSLLILITTQSVHILLECFLVSSKQMNI